MNICQQACSAEPAPVCSLGRTHASRDRLHGNACRLPWSAISETRGEGARRRHGRVATQAAEAEGKRARRTPSSSTGLCSPVRHTPSIGGKAGQAPAGRYIICDERSHTARAPHRGGASDPPQPSTPDGNSDPSGAQEVRSDLHTPGARTGFVYSEAPWLLARNATRAGTA